METKPTPGNLLRAALAGEKPLQVAGTINAYAALLAQQCGFRAIYLSGAGVANASFGLPDLGMTTLSDVTEEVRRITAASPLPLLVDADTGWGHAFMVARTVRELIRAGAAGMHIEDQVAAKRCGHRPGKALVSAGEMADRIKAAVDARTESGFVIMARTDAAAVEGVDAAIERALRYREAGADMIFPEALTELGQFRRFADALQIPVLANMTEFGVTPLFGTAELANAGVSLALYPLSAFRAMSTAALRVYRAIRSDGSQAGVVESMQSRAELYDVLSYHDYEAKLDELFGKESKP
jgi:methylisocitrate lyase